MKLDSNFNSGNEPNGRTPKCPPEGGGTLAMNTVVLQITTANGGTWTYEKLPWSELGVICEQKLKEQKPTIFPTL